VAATPEDHRLSRAIGTTLLSVFPQAWRWRALRFNDVLLGLDRPVSRAALVRIHEASGGNPLYALEIAHGLDRGDPRQVGARLPVPASLRELVAERIPALAPDARAALLAAAASSQPTVELVEAASSPDGLAAAEESGLLRVDGVRVVFAHPLYASAVYTAAATSRRRGYTGGWRSWSPIARSAPGTWPSRRPCPTRASRARSRTRPRSPARAAHGTPRQRCSSTLAL
jgi:hypothetical protein